MRKLADKEKARLERRRDKICKDLDEISVEQGKLLDRQEKLDQAEHHLQESLEAIDDRLAEDELVREQEANTKPGTKVAPLYRLLRLDKGLRLVWFLRKTGRKLW